MTTNATSDHALIAALALQQEQRWQEAEQAYVAILQNQPDHAAASHNLGSLYVQLGNPQQALPHFEVALNVDPVQAQYWLSYLDALHRAGFKPQAQEILQFAKQQGLAGAAMDALTERLNRNHSSQSERENLIDLFNRKQWDEAEWHARTLTQYFPADPFAWKALGTVLQQCARLQDALSPLQHALTLSPADAELHNNLGIVLKGLGQTEAAIKHYREALKLAPTRADTHYNLGNVLHGIGQSDQAAQSFKTALQYNPNLAAALNNLGNIVRLQGQIQEAEALYRRALAIAPDYDDAHSNLGIALHEQEQYAAAETSLRQALRLNPKHNEAHSNLALVLKDTGRLSEAETHLRHALELSPADAETRYNLGHTLLMAGAFQAGWPEYEFRWEGSAPPRPRPPITTPQWRGERPAPSDRLLIIKEQGLGDQIQFCRYLELALTHFPAGVSCVVSGSLSNLLRRSFPQIEILETLPSATQQWQWHCPLLSLPYAFGTSLETIPSQVPYLYPDSERVTHWQSRIDALNLPQTTRKVGLVWKPGQRMKNAPQRALTLAQISPLFTLAQHTWFSLQKEPDPDRLTYSESGKLIDWSEELIDFNETAALASCLDLVIAVDTSVAHLAGALARPVWLLNRYASEWRWRHNREDSPWYPTLRIFTQPAAGDWDSVVQRLAAALTAVE